MKKWNALLCLATAVLFMTACGKNDTQAQTPVFVTESSAEESTVQSTAPQSDIPEKVENINAASMDMDSIETKMEEIPESSISNVGEDMTESVTDTGKTESMQEIEVHKEDNIETDTQDNMEDTVMNMNVQVGDVVFSATLEKNEAVDAFVEMMQENPVVIQMSDYSGFEKVGSLGTSLPVSNSQTTTHAGDIVLYNGNQIVIFYGSNSWSYTRLGHIDDLTGWEEALGSGDVTVTFSLQ